MTSLLILTFSLDSSQPPYHNEKRSSKHRSDLPPPPSQTTHAQKADWETREEIMQQELENAKMRLAQVRIDTVVLIRVLLQHCW